MNSQGVGISQEDEDLAAIVVPPNAKFGGGALLLLGVLTLILGLQTVLVVRRYEPLLITVIVIMFTLGLGSAWLGFQTTRGSGTATIAGIGFAIVTFVLSGAWFVYALVHNVVSLLALGLLPLAVTAILFGALSIGWAKRADVARERLRAQGLDAGL